MPKIIWYFVEATNINIDEAELWKTANLRQLVK